MKLDELVTITRTDIDRLKEIFVTRQECEQDMSVIKSDVNHVNTRLAVIESNQKIILWVLAAVASGVITMLIKMFFGG